MEILRKIIKILESKTSEREIKHAFDGLIRWIDMTKERIAELGDMSIEICQTEKQREKNDWNWKKSEQSI
jgi:hypothetical protein